MVACLILGFLLCAALLILTAGGNGSVGKYQVALALLGTGERGSRQLIVAVIDTETGEVRFQEHSKVPESINLFK
jgi:hypothetical protein